MAGSPWIRQATDPGPNRPGSGRPVNLALTGAVATQRILTRRGRPRSPRPGPQSVASTGVARGAAPSCRHGRWEGYLSGAARSLPVPDVGRPCRPARRRTGVPRRPPPARAPRSRAATRSRSRRRAAGRPARRSTRGRTAGRPAVAQRARGPATWASISAPPGRLIRVTSPMAEGFAGGDRSPGEDQVQGAPQAHDARQPDGAAVDQRDAPSAAEDAECRFGIGHAQVAPERQFEAAGDRVAVDRGDHRLAQHAAGSGPSPAGP